MSLAGRLEEGCVRDGEQRLIVEVLGGIGDVTAAEWNACAGAGDPFVEHAFLAALEASGSVSAERGWLPRHLVARTTDGRMQGALPLYLKGHSYGEYVFDWAWAEAFERAGGRYYPKLQAAIPFTPVTGRRILVWDGAPPGTSAALTDAALRLVEKLGASSLHVTFPTEQEACALASRGFMRRMGHQFHWCNRGYSSFDDFVGDLMARKRKSIRRERQKAIEGGLVLRTLTGCDIHERHWDAFWHFYLDTTQRKWANVYLTRDFFFRLGQTMADRVVLVIAEAANGRPIAGALNLLGQDALYGRYWGALEDRPFLHFEACYYRAIDFAIEHRLARIEAGAQGEHKVHRGYLPQRTWSAHWIIHDGLRRAVGRFLEAERPAVEAQIALLASESPYHAADET
jgi:predicted N-acyltransferase